MEADGTISRFCPESNHRVTYSVQESFLPIYEHYAARIANQEMKKKDLQEEYTKAIVYAHQVIDTYIKQDNKHIIRMYKNSVQVGKALDEAKGVALTVFAELAKGWFIMNASRVLC